MALADAGMQPNVKIKFEEEEVSDVKGCYIWFSENVQPNFLDETTVEEGKVIRIKKRRCAVANCANFFCQGGFQPEGRLLSFHRFPRDEQMREIWAKLCYRIDKFSAKSAFICSNHFKPDDYVTKMLENNMVKINRLRPGVIPSMNLPDNCLKPTELSITQDGADSSDQGYPVSLSDQENEMEVSLVPSREKLSSSLKKRFNLLKRKGAFNSNGFNKVPVIYGQNLPLSVGSRVESPEVSRLPRLDNEKVPSRRKFTKKRSQGIFKEQFLEPRGTSVDSEVITINSSSEEENADELNKEMFKHHELVKKKELNLLKVKYKTLEECFQELKVKNNEEIERLNGIIKVKDEEFNKELREVLSVFLKAEEVEEIVRQARW